MVQIVVLADEQIGAIHQATLHILSQVGIVLAQPQAREILGQAGTALRGDRVQIPPKLVEQALSHCPRQVTLRGRGEKAAVLGDGSLHY